MKTTEKGKKIFIVTSFIYWAIVLLYEICYCNFEFLLKMISKYNVSIYRIIMYIVTYIIIYKFKDKFINSALEAFEVKAKSYFVKIILVSSAVLIYLLILTGKLLTLNAVILLIATLLVILFAIYLSKDIIKNIIVITLTFGIIFSLAIPFNNQLDEKRHFLASYSMVLGEFNLRNALVDKTAADMPRKMNVQEFVTFFSINPSNEIIRGNSYEINDMACDYFSLSYIPSGLGIFIAKTLGGSIGDIYITGRIFNLLGYTFLTALTLKVLPYKKKIAFSIFCMPMLLALASVYSPDGIGTAITYLFIAYCLKLHENQNIKLKEALILLVLLILSASIKSVGYVGIALVILILPLRNIIKKNKKYMIYVLIISIILLSIVASIFIDRLQQSGDTRSEGTCTSGQVSYILKYPLKYGELLISHFLFVFTDFRCTSYINAPMFFNTTYYYVFVAILIYLLYISLTDSSKQLSIKTRVIFFLTFLIIFVMTSTAMYISYTKVGSDYINGYQMRYIFPFIFLLLSSISVKKLEIKNTKFKLNDLYMNIILSIFLIISVFDAIII